MSYHLDLHKLRVGQEISREGIETLLQEVQYKRVEFAAHPGEYAMRGMTVDIYPLTYRLPVRLETRLDKITAISDYSPVDGNSTQTFEEVLLIPLTEVFSKKISSRAKDFENFEPVSEIKDLRQGDYVVHLKYGIGRFLGTKSLQVKGEKRKHLAIEYANREIIYVEMHEPLERYIGGEGRGPKLTKLHGKEWESAKARTRAAVSEVAKHMIEIQAKRELHKRPPFPKDHAWQKQFEAEFPFEATPDQDKAIQEVKRDMESPQPMDRLIAGDVGYGKTEVAIRAAFKAVNAGKQVAILVPTTVLAEQHYLVLKNRMKNYPVKVEALSRFRSKKDQAHVVASLKKGETDIVVGTHRLLSKDIQFKDLGLLIVDEEQRFGVTHKDRLKHFRAMLDVITMTATPIPRTLYMSIVGVRDMSAINTPPKMRLPIETYISEYDNNLIQKAIQREIARKGQVYFIHNRVQSIEKVYKHLQQLLPGVRFGVGHGQMHADELERVMQDFMDHKIDCLIATNIVESGIDIPNVNTIIVDRADLFGLADMYQLRGRVGRYHEKRQAYAYFLVPKRWVLPKDAEKRLSAIERFTDLGSGFKIALEDLEIRGAGNLLGHEQSGFIHAVGFDLYCKMLRKAIEEEKKARGKAR